ncbi:MAG TPA: ATP-dependent DNA helicase [Caulobacteraceae bacterium]|nr:ATP-dependent DNA helicase [Caulobacteraceae bacterium]
MNAPRAIVASKSDLAPALAVLPGGRAAIAQGAGAGRDCALEEARALFSGGPVVLVHAAMTAQRLGLPPPPRSRRLFDVLELFAFVRPAAFCAPSAVGLARALGLDEPRGAGEQAQALVAAAAALLHELACEPHPSRAEALALAETLGRAGWAWADQAVMALDREPAGRPWRGDGLDVWRRIAEWEDRGPEGPAGSRPIEPEAAARRLAELLARAGLDEERPAQRAYAQETAHAFQPRKAEGEPMMVLAEAGTGVGKTLGYLAPASLFAAANGGAVWVSTFTRALQRQIERECRWVFPDPADRGARAVVRKGRENYLCLLNLQEAVNGARLGGADVVGLALAARWARASRDGDMTGGDFPAWLPGLFAVSPQAQASAANLVDRRGECIHSACPHYRACFVERAIRASRGADIVIANHALVMTHAAFDRAREGAADAETLRLKRIVFDEGHHLFDAADQAFSACLSGAEAAEMRRWIRGPEGRGRRGRGLPERLGDLLSDHEAARAAVETACRAAAALPGEGWSGRIAPPEGVSSQPAGAVEAFLAAVVEQLRARAEPSDIGMECDARPALAQVREAAGRAGQALAAVEAPLLDLRRGLADMLDEEADELAAAERARIEGALRGLDRRAGLQLPAWRAMLAAIARDEADHPDFVDWFEASFLYGRLVDGAFRRHWVDPTEPLAGAVIAPAHGVLVTSATLADPALDDPFALAQMRTGAARLPAPAKTVRLASPFAYARLARAFVVTDVRKDDARQVAAAMRELFLAAGGGALGLFTAVRRLRAVHARIAAPLAEKGLSLFAQHVDPLEAGSLIDIFRAEEDACLLGTDAVRDGVDLPGRSLRLLVFDRVPWPRPDLLHKARRERFGGRGFDDAVARARIAQAFGRLIRRADDKGVFVLLDAAAPTRLFASLPEGISVERVSLVEAIEATSAHLR